MRPAFASIMDAGDPPSHIGVTIACFTVSAGHAFVPVAFLAIKSPDSRTRSHGPDRRTEIVALTLGHRGAVLVAHDRAIRAERRRPMITPLGSVGAGDSFLGAMVWGLAAGHNPAYAMQPALDDLFSVMAGLIRAVRGEPK